MPHPAPNLIVLVKKSALASVTSWNDLLDKTVSAVEILCGRQRQLTHVGRHRTLVVALDGESRGDSASCLCSGIATGRCVALEHIVAKHAELAGTVLIDIDDVIVECLTGEALHFIVLSGIAWLLNSFEPSSPTVS